MVNSVELKVLCEPSRLAERTHGKPSAVAVGLVKNEGDMIATWLSHLCALFDMVYLVDHQSVDGTREFLIETAKSQGNIRVFSFDHPGYFQAEIVNQLAAMAAHEYRSSWIFPLDADEFVSVASRTDLTALIEDLAPNRVLGLPWKNCIPVCLMEDVEFTFVSPCLIPPSRGAYKKLAMHSSAFATKNWRFQQGNHAITDSTGSAVGVDAQSDIADLLHLPIRSLDHFALKCVQGYLAYEALPAARKQAGQGFHWTDMIEMVLENGTLSPDVVRGFAANYGQPQLCSDKGLSIYNLADTGWTCGALDVAHLQVPHTLDRLSEFSDLSHEMLRQKPSRKLEKFLRIVGSEDLPEAPHTTPEATLHENQMVFSRLPSVPSQDDEAVESCSDMAVLSEFFSDAFAAHEDPVPSTWKSHVPFLLCLLNFMKPRRFVEIGTAWGHCFFAACQASRAMGWGVECVAIDTWEGDEHTGHYSEDVFRQFTHILHTKYRQSATYLRRTFDEANLQFAPGSIDLLHIDGLHTYEAVSHDYLAWLPKMSDRGVIMFHDTQERGRGFGVWRLWHEVRESYPSFEFAHGHGLGIILVGSKPAPKVRKLFDIIAQPDYGRFVRFFFSHLGELSDT